MNSKALNDHLKSVADAIRAKKGTTDLINPQDFAEEIGAISGGGEGGSNVEYLDVRNVTDTTSQEIPLKLALVNYAQLAKYDHPNGVGGINIETPSSIQSWATEEQVVTMDYISVAIDFNAIRAVSKTGVETVLFFFAILGVTQEQLDSIPRITKEEFYDLTA